MAGRALMLIAALCLGTAAEAAPTAKKAPRAKTLRATPAITVLPTQSEASSRWRLRPANYTLETPRDPLQWRFTGTRVKMKLAF